MLTGHRTLNESKMMDLLQQALETRSGQWRQVARVAVINLVLSAVDDFLHLYLRVTEDWLRVSTPPIFFGNRRGNLSPMPASPDHKLSVSDEKHRRAR